MKIQLNEQYNTITTLNNYFMNIKDMYRISTNGTIPISEAELLATTYVNIKSTAIYNNNMEKLGDRIIRYKDWANYRCDF